jgi:hypothetical protein
MQKETFTAPLPCHTDGGYRPMNPFFSKAKVIEFLNGLSQTKGPVRTNDCCTKRLLVRPIDAPILHNTKAVRTMLKVDGQARGRTLIQMNAPSSEERGQILPTDLRVNVMLPLCLRTTL